MNTKHPLIPSSQIAALLLLSTLSPQLSTFAQGTAFTYQGRLNDGANVASGSYDMMFSLFSAASGSGQIGNTVTNSIVISNGLFTTTLDFGSQFTGADLWLEIGVRTNGSSSFTTLIPRQELTPTPYAITAVSLSGSLPAAQLTSIGNTNGSGNFFVGPSGNSTTEGGNNTAIGDYALSFNTIGSYNTASGAGALSLNTSGNNNAAFGENALSGLTTGSGNIAVGQGAGTAISTGNNNIDIGNSGFGNETGVIRIGTVGTHTKAVMNGIFGTTVGGGAAVQVNANGLLGTVTSSRRFKQNIQGMAGASDVLLALHPVTFQYKPDPDPEGTPQFGLIAEDVEKVNPALVLHDDKHQIYTVRYEAVNAMLLNEFLKEHRKVEEQSRQIEVLKEKAIKVDSLENRLNELQALVKQLAAQK